MPLLGLKNYRKHESKYQIENTGFMQLALFQNNQTNFRKGELDLYRAEKAFGRARSSNSYFPSMENKYFAPREQLSVRR